MPPRKNPDQNTDDTEAVTAVDLQKLESSLRSLLDEQFTKLISDVNSPIKTPVKTLDTSEPGQKNYSQYSSRLTKINFPKFDGDDLKSWLYKCNQFFDLDGISDENKISLAAIHLEGIALWTEYVAGITARFGDIYDDPMADLKALKQIGTIQKYHDAFDALASRLNLSQEYLISCYIGGRDSAGCENVLSNHITTISLSS
ncbi:uncharacterized protein LOC110706513 [Chenopodium quinoa]|uniref:uncharacterized protein LOC110706513 n=1 Tax=Chenopodium quinoa TaxID=63459 RepID=UPI000B78EC21|nr:uncharacterized protein LOC110706513 [Chenopodium quinoa]